MHACPNCRRHIRENECPFCHTVSDAPDAKLGPASRVGLRRSALVASVVVAAGCAPAPTPAYGVPVDVNMTDDASSDVPATMDVPVTVDAAYGIPPQDVVSEDNGPAPAYGLPPDASFDSGPPDDSGVAPAYGLPPDSGSTE